MNLGRGPDSTESERALTGLVSRYPVERDCAENNRTRQRAALNSHRGL